ncbi:MAG TPA: ABC transporter ATP-binding protein [Dongiaceae bacterium]|jgi:iron(III) transport system ATP-binding protein
MAGDILTLERVSHSYDGKRDVVSDFSLTIGAGEIVCLLGPSGCGKSTVLRLAAGLEPLQRGQIRIRGEPVADGAHGLSEAPELRHVGLMFQDFALFPHLSVAGNVGFGLVGRPESIRRGRIQETLDQVGMGDYAAAYPHRLSGGQQQRVALARALAPEPSIMLLDEPFSGLDARLREQIRDDTLRVLKLSGAATLLVTHDPEEAMFMADRIYLMQAGRVIQAGPPSEIYNRPNSLFSAQFFSNINELEAIAHNQVAMTIFGSIPAPGQPDGPVRVVFRPESLNMVPLNGGIPRHVVVPGVVEESRFIGVARLVKVHVTPSEGPPCTLQARATGPYAAESGAKVGLWLDPSQAFVFGPGDSVGAGMAWGPMRKIAKPPLADRQTRA